MRLQKLNGEFAVCKVADYSQVDFTARYCFTGKTDTENSLVCLADDVPGNAVCCDGGWKGFRVEGELDFGLVGILASLAGILAEAGIPIFAVSTYNTDYLFVKADRFQKAVESLEQAGIDVREA